MANKKSIFIVSVIILFTAAASAVWYANKPEIIENKDPNLTQEERAIYENRLKDANEALARENLVPEEQFNLHMYKGMQLYGLGRFKDAALEYETAARVQPENFNAPAALFTAYREMQDNKKAKAAALKALELNPKDSSMWRNYISFAEERLKFSEKAMDELYVEALGKSETDVDIVVWYAEFNERRGRLEEAKNLWAEAVKQFPNIPDYKAALDRVTAKMSQ